MIWLKNNWRYLFIMALFAVVGSMAYRAGVDRVQAQWNAERRLQAGVEAKRVKALADYKGQLQAITDILSSNIAISDSKAHIQKEIITKEVIKYVQKDNNPADVVDNDWLRIYNHSISRAD